MAAEAAYTPAIRQALKAFAVASDDVRFVHLSENATFRVVGTSHGRDLALRFHRPGYHDIEELRSEQIWTDALAEAGIRVPRSLRDPAGASHVETALGPGNARRWASMSQWLHGRVMREVLETTEDPAEALNLFRQLGNLLAEAHNQAAAWLPPAGFLRRRLDADGLMGDKPVWGPFWRYFGFSAAQRSLLKAARDVIRAKLVDYGVSAETFGIIHADLHPGNVIVTADGLAMIDFDDCGFGWHVYDLAIALIWLRDHPFFPALRDACLAGYREKRPLAVRDVDMLPLFMLARGMAQFGWFHERPELEVPPEVHALRDWVCDEAARLFEG